MINNIIRRMPEYKTDCEALFAKSLFRLDAEFTDRPVTEKDAYIANNVKRAIDAII